MFDDLNNLPSPESQKGGLDYKLNTNYNISKVEYRSIKRSIGKNKYVNIPYEALVLGFEKALKNMRDRVGACESVMDIVVTQMSVGKSTCTDTDLRRLVKKYLPEIQLILRLSAKRDTSDDGVFTTDQDNWCGLGFHTPKEFESSIKSTEYALNHSQDISYCMSMTHSLFVHKTSQNVIDFLNRNQHRILIVIEEAHEYIACPIEGASEAAKVSGNNGGAPYHAVLPKTIFEWTKNAPYVMGLTATPTVAQNGMYGIGKGVNKNGVVSDILYVANKESDLEFPFRVIDASAELEDLIPHQSWIDKVKGYQYQHKNPYSATNSLRGSLGDVLKKEKVLRELSKKYDSNVTPKCVWMGVFGRGGKSSGWGMPIDEGKNQTLKYLNDNNFDKNKFCIITMTKNGIEAENLKGEKKKIEDDKTACKILNDPHDDAQFLFVVNKGTSGLNIHRISNLFIGRVRSLKLLRIERLIQIYGRCVRLNVGTNVIGKSIIKNDIRNYIDVYRENYDISLDIILKTLLISNTFSITIPTGYVQRKTKRSPLKHDVEVQAMKEFTEKFCNKVEKGRDFLLKFIGGKGVMKCPTCGTILNKNHLDGKFEFTWDEFGALDEFFNM